MTDAVTVPAAAVQVRPEISRSIHSHAILRVEYPKTSSMEIGHWIPRDKAVANHQVENQAPRNISREKHGCNSGLNNTGSAEIVYSMVILEKESGSEWCPNIVL